jgi:hypothetical protein
MSTCHRIAVITLLSSSIAAASPAAAPPRPAAKTVHGVLARFIDQALVHKVVRANEHRRVRAVTDDDGYPLVGNMHGKRAAPEEPEPTLEVADAK